MKDVVLMIAVLAAFAFGFYIMKCVDDFLYENYKNKHSETENREAPCVMLTDNMTEDEIIKEIRDFKKKHEYMEIYLCDKTVSDTSKRVVGK